MSIDTFFQILTVGGFAGVVSAFFGGFLREHFENKERKRKARHLALKLSLALEAYYHTCKDEIHEILTYQNSSGSAGSNEAGLPILEEYPNDPIAWTYLSQDVADSVLNFRAIIRSKDDISRFNAYLDNEPDGPDPDPTLEALYEIAIISINLAKYIRSQYDLPKLVRTRDSERRIISQQERFLVRLGEHQQKSWRASEKIMSCLDEDGDRKAAVKS